MQKLKQLARKSKTAIIASKLYTNWRMERNFARGTIEAEMGSTHSQKTIEESLAYIELQYRDYCRYGGLGPEQFKAKSILELGCGDNVGVAVRFLVDGADRVVCLDKFYAVRDPERERQIYVELRKRLSSDQIEVFDSIMDPINGRRDESLLRCVYGMELNEFAAADPEVTFDFVLSCAVIEEIYDPEALFRSIDRALKPGGLTVHKIDLSDYGMFGNNGMNPLTFLTIPEWIYRRMASESAIPNRKLMGYYRDLMERMGYDAQILITSIIGTGNVVPYKKELKAGADYGATELSLIEAIRPKLDREFADLKNEDLLVDGIFLVGRKPS